MVDNGTGGARSGWVRTEPRLIAYPACTPASTTWRGKTRSGSTKRERRAAAGHRIGVTGSSGSAPRAPAIAGRRRSDHGLLLGFGEPGGSVAIRVVPMPVFFSDLACFGFFTSRLDRLWPLAIATSLQPRQIDTPTAGTGQAEIWLLGC